MRLIRVLSLTLVLVLVLKALNLPASQWYMLGVVVLAFYINFIKHKALQINLAFSVFSWPGLIACTLIEWLILPFDMQDMF